MNVVITRIVKENFVDIIITGIGSVEEDIMKTNKEFLLGNFNLDDTKLHKKGLNRIGNVLVDGDHYCFLEDLYFLKMKWIQNPSPLKNRMLPEIPELR